MHYSRLDSNPLIPTQIGLHTLGKSIANNEIARVWSLNELVDLI